MDNDNIDELDREDMSRLVAGEDDALNRLMERHAGAVFQFLVRMLGNEDEANDLAQETFVRVYQARESFKQGQKFSTWLYTIAANLARNQYRWRQRHPNVSLDAVNEPEEYPLKDRLAGNAPTPEEAAIAQERAFAVRSAVQGLPDDTREAVVLCEWQELPVAEAATILKTTTKAVEARLYRARKLLRERLAKWL